MSAPCYNPITPYAVSVPIQFTECSECGAIVRYGYEAKHSRWHELVFLRTAS